MEWIQGHLTGVVDPIVDACIKEMKGKLGVKSLGAVGYCFGAKYVARFLNKGQVDAGFVAHPSFVDDEEIKGMTGPFSIAAAGMLGLFSVIDSRLDAKSFLSCRNRSNLPYREASSY